MNRTAVEEIKARLPIEDVVGSYVKLEKSGRSLKARCPFHNEKSPSFFVSPDRGGYYCFGCGAKGDIFSFVQQFEGLDFRGALKLLAEKAGVPLVTDRKADGERDRMFQVMEEAAQYFESQYDKSSIAKEYVKSRGILPETQKLFRIGWAPEGWSNLHNFLKGKGWSDNLLEKVGLIKNKETAEISPKQNSSNYYDRFRGRVMFPITDSGGRVIAFSGRILKDDGKSAKYLNSPETPLYDKSSVLYGLDKAKNEIRRLNYSILVEGQMDLVMSHQAGVRNTVAASGTALSDQSVNKEGVTNNLGLIRRLSPNVIIAFDSDEPGRKAAMRASGISLALGMDVKIADITGGKDPADLVKEDVNLWKKSLREAKHVIEFELDNVLREVADQRKVLRALQERIFPLLVNIEKDTDRGYFVGMIRDRARINSEDVIWNDLKVITERLKAENTKTPSSTKSNSRTSSEVTKNIDRAERQLFGILYLMDKAGLPSAREYRNRLKDIAGVSYEDRFKQASLSIEDLAFEAEAYFGSDQEKWDKHFKEILLNFEKDIIDQELVSTMQELRTAEKLGQNDRVVELAKKCQELSIRKAGIGKRK